MLLSLPREIGPHPEDGITVWANIGRYGPYLKHAPARLIVAAPMPTLRASTTFGPSA